jgi:3-dehydroquinate dehydratase II
MHRILVVHGPNLNLLGTREPEIYGSTTLAEIDRALQTAARGKQADVHLFQSNHEGAIIDAIHNARTSAAGIIINPGAFTHYAYAIADALASVRLPAIEVHLSNIYAREEYRRHSVVAPAVVGTICGLGWRGYLLALDALVTLLDERAQSSK